MTDTRQRRVYCASRASNPYRPKMWQQLRADLAPRVLIISTWIDEAGKGETVSMMDLWTRIESEIKECDHLVLYVKRDDLPLKGAFVEVGMALALNKPVIVCAPDIESSEHRSLLGSWVDHPGVFFCTDVENACLGL